MFSLIVTILAIVLVAALAIATIYYGGSSFLEGNTRIAAATLLNQGAQIAGSTMLYNEDQQVVPSRPSDLVAQHYLKELPLPPKVAYLGDIEPKRSDWEWFSPSTVHVVLRNKINEKACREVNIKANQTSDIPPIMKPEWIVQCYGLGEPYTFYFDPPGIPQHEREEIARTLADPLPDVSPDPVDFGTHLVGVQSPPVDLTVTNIGGGVLLILNMEFTGDFGGYSDCLAMPMWNGQFCTVTTWFEPTAVGVRTGGLSLENNSIDNPYTVSLKGRGSLTSSPVISVTPNPVQFPDTSRTTTSAPETVTITNIGSAPFNIGTPVIAGPYAQTHTCPISLDVSSSCEMLVTFSPPTSGSLPGTLTLSGNLDVPVVVPLLGTGTSGAPATPDISFNPPFINYGPLKVGLSSAAVPVIMTNSGNAPFILDELTISGPFSFTHDCTSMLTAKASCNLLVKFNPVALGSSNGMVTVTGNTAGPNFLNLTGTGSAGANLVANPDHVDFGSYVISSQSPLIPITVTNTGGESATITGLTVTGMFTASSDCSGTVLAPNAYCTIQAGFEPTASGNLTGQIAIANTTGVNPLIVPLTGHGSVVTSPAITFTPNPLNFGNIEIGSNSAPQTMTATNTGSANFALSSLTMSGPFTSTHNCPALLAPTASCSINVTFTPISSGTASGSVTLAGNLASPAVGTLTGNGTSPVVSTSGGGHCIPPLATITNFRDVSDGSHTLYEAYPLSSYFTNANILDFSDTGIILFRPYQNTTDFYTADVFTEVVTSVPKLTPDGKTFNPLLLATDGRVIGYSTVPSATPGTADVSIWQYSGNTLTLLHQPPAQINDMAIVYTITKGGLESLIENGYLPGYAAKSGPVVTAVVWHAATNTVHQSSITNIYYPYTTTSTYWNTWASMKNQFASDDGWAVGGTDSSSRSSWGGSIYSYKQLHRASPGVPLEFYTNQGISSDMLWGVVGIARQGSNRRALVKSDKSFSSMAGGAAYTDYLHDEISLIGPTGRLTVLNFPSGEPRQPYYKLRTNSILDMTTQGCVLGKQISAYTKYDINVGAFGLNLEDNTTTLPATITGKLHYRPSSSAGYGYNPNYVNYLGRPNTAYFARITSVASIGPDGLPIQDGRGGTHINNHGMIIGWALQVGSTGYASSWLYHFPTLGNVVLMVPKKQ